MDGRPGINWPVRQKNMDARVSLIEDIMSATILVVDDMSLMRQMIGLCLSKAGFANIIYAEDGDVALDQIRQHSPDIVILDLAMPRVSGFEVCRAVRADPALVNLPILVQSASEEPEERVEVFHAGGTDFVTKPINQPEMVARVKMHLENRMLIRNLSKFENHMRQELAIARDMQHSLLPDRSSLERICDSYYVEVESEYRASFELGGDLWGTWALDDTRFGLFVLDMSGHGVGAAMNTFRAHALMGRLWPSKDNPARFLTDLNKALRPHLPLGQFATMFYAVVDVAAHTMTFAGAGAPRPLLFRRNDDVIKLDSSGFPIGIAENPDYHNQTVPFAEGDCLLCYSDVLLETPSHDGEILGEEGFSDLAHRVFNQTSGRPYVDAVLSEFSAIHGPALGDDLTIVAIRRLGAPGHDARK